MDIPSAKRGPGRKIDIIGWILFVVWIGVIVATRWIPRGVGSIGLGVITLGVTLIRVLAGVSYRFYWVVIGCVFLFAGAGELAGIDLPLLPVALIICGILLLFHRKRRKII